jgi:hypothetical protein
MCLEFETIEKRNEGNCRFPPAYYTVAESKGAQWRCFDRICEAGVSRHIENSGHIRYGRSLRG